MATVAFATLHSVQRDYLLHTLKVSKKRKNQSSVPHHTDPATKKALARGDSATEYYSTDAGTQYDRRVSTSETHRFIHRLPGRGTATWWLAIHVGAFNGFNYFEITGIQEPEVAPQPAVRAPAAVH